MDENKCKGCMGANLIHIGGNIYETRYEDHTCEVKLVYNPSPNHNTYKTEDMWVIDSRETIKNDDGFEPCCKDE